jgi:hypothetical protein
MADAPKSAANNTGASIATAADAAKAERGKQEWLRYLKIEFKN